MITCALPGCGNLLSTRWRVRFCSRQCAGLSRWVHHQPKRLRRQERLCVNPGCGEVVTGDYRNIYCSRTCASRDHEDSKRRKMVAYLQTPRGKVRKRSTPPRGVEHWNWRGGTSFEPYTSDWKHISFQIRKRDGFMCRHIDDTCIGSLGVHHINGDKKDNRPENLISLCGSHHYRMECLLWEGLI